jgi:hypothetical protein
MNAASNLHRKVSGVTSALVRIKKKGVTTRVTHGVILTIDPRRRPSMCHHTI